MRKWLILALGAFIAGGGIMNGVPALFPLGAGVGLFGYVWFSFGTRLARLAKGEDMGCLHLAREFGYETDGECSRCHSGAGYEIERWVAIGAWLGFALCGAAALIIALAPLWER